MSSNRLKYDECASLNHTNDKHEIKYKIEKLRLFLKVQEQNKFFNRRMKIIIEETEYLSLLYDSIN